jgi:hypothetical protein
VRVDALGNFKLRYKLRMARISHVKNGSAGGRGDVADITIAIFNGNQTASRKIGSADLMDSLFSAWNKRFYVHRTFPPETQEE